MNYISIKLLKKCLGEYHQILLFYICAPIRTEFCPYIKWNICKDMIDITFLVHCILLILCNMYQSSLMKKFCFPSKHNIYHYLCSWFYELLGNSVAPIFLWQVHPLWCLCSCGFSITFSNTFINIVLENTMFALVLEKLLFW